MNDMQDFETLLANGDLDAAEQLCLTLAQQDPRAAEPRLGLVKISRIRRDMLELKARLERYLALRPQAIDAWANLLHIRGKHGDLAGARAELPALEALYLSKEFDRLAGQRLLDLLQFSLTGSDRRQALVRLRERVAILEKRARPTLASRLAARISPLKRRSARPKTPSLDTPEQLKALLASLHLALKDYEAFHAVVAALPDKGTSGQIFKKLKWVDSKVAHQPFPDNKAEKIIALGLSRTGTTSLNAALNQLGIHAIHWINPLTRAVIEPDDIPLFDGFTDISAAHDFEALYHAYPNAKFILTTRDPQSWERSVRAHYKANYGSEDLAELRLHALYSDKESRSSQVFWAIYGQHDSWQDAYQAHHQRVRSFFADKPCDRFLELAITEGQGFKELCRFLKMQAPERPFPNVNARIKTREATTERRLK